MPDLWTDPCGLALAGDPRGIRCGCDGGNSGALNHRLVYFRLFPGFFDQFGNLLNQLPEPEQRKLLPD